MAKTLSLDNDQYRQLFIEEAKEHIDTLTKSMLILDVPNVYVRINQVQRCNHRVSR